MQFDWFIDTIPEVIERVEQAGLHGKQEQARKMVLDVVQVRFPVLMDFAQMYVTSITQPEQLSKLLIDLMQASDETAAIRFLTRK